MHYLKTGGLAVVPGGLTGGLANGRACRVQVGLTVSTNTYQLSALGMVCALGSELPTIRQRLLAGDRGGLRTRSAGVPPRPISTAPVTDPLPTLPPALLRWNSRNAQLMLAAYQQIAPAVAALRQALGPGRLGVVMGSSTSGVERGEKAIVAYHRQGQMPPDFHYEQQEMGTVARLMSAMSGAEGPAFTVSTACSSSSKIFASARQLLALDLCDAVIVGGADSLCELTLQGFASLEALSPLPCNPMSVNRLGITMGEGAACMLLTRAAGGVRLLGIGEASDAHHMSAPDPQGTGAALAMTAALADAGLPPSAIDYVNLHGTATALNDAMESQAVARVLGLSVPCSSTKALHGHALGAAGVLELGLCWLLLDESAGPWLAPPHLWDGQRDPALPALHLVAPGELLPRRGAWRRCLSNSFAFGGNNCAVIIGRQDPEGAP